MDSTRDAHGRMRIEEKEMQMDFFELLKVRRSVRDYEDKDVPIELIQEIIKDSTFAPNAGNMQLWRFVIVNNREWVKKCADSSKNKILAGIEADPDSPMKGYAETLKNPDFCVFYNAPAVVYLVGSKRAGTLPHDCGLLAAYFMLSATSRGLGTCWVAQGADIEPELREELGIPENYSIEAPIILGYPKAPPAIAERKEPKILKIVS